MVTGGFKLCLARGIITLPVCPEYLGSATYGDAGWPLFRAAIRYGGDNDKAECIGTVDQKICREPAIGVAKHRYRQTESDAGPGPIVRAEFRQSFARQNSTGFNRHIDEIDEENHINARTGYMPDGTGDPFRTVHPGSGNPPAE